MYVGLTELALLAKQLGFSIFKQNRPALASNCILLALHSSERAF